MFHLNKRGKMKTRIYFSILLIAALLAPASIAVAAPSADSTHFRLEANAGWIDSGYFVEAGGQLRITAYGQAVTAPINVFGSGSVSGPDGQGNICPNYDGAPPCAMENAPYGALVGKIGADGTPFLIGSNFTLTADTAGDFYLAVNDLLPYYSDNYGNYIVFFNH